ncbi:hypothetical protein I7I50_09267 [Histoplasma capsulatum G186AR]|uniref:Uncharacterized protein n=1 Tax=Ajellomyces capsulatus TaxID=5037 RepID=A0A8H7YTY7_AJECA|nr:hypothetical protein I7I52_06788 [Histoplasma capsulatum]QSS74195.1 hypothetical protein I7I50_09267 [Histoplasma capsulatum G186AR]
MVTVFPAFFGARMDRQKTVNTIEDTETSISYFLQTWTQHFDRYTARRKSFGRSRTETDTALHSRGLSSKKLQEIQMNRSNA